MGAPSARNQNSDPPEVRGQHVAVRMRPEVRFRRIPPLRKLYSRWRELPDLVELERRGLRLGRHVTIQPWAHIDREFPQLVSIGDGTTVSLRVTVLAHELGRLDEHGRPWAAPVVIGAGVFLGAGAVVLPGTTIGDGCIIGAGSVVSGDIPAGSLVVGNPGRILRETDEYIAWHRGQRAAHPGSYAR